MQSGPKLLGEHVSPTLFIGRATEAGNGMGPAPTRQGVLAAPTAPGRGQWRPMAVAADGTRFRRRQEFYVKG